MTRRLSFMLATLAAMTAALVAGCASTTKIEPAKANAERTVNNGKTKTTYRYYPPEVKP